MCPTQSASWGEGIQTKVRRGLGIVGFDQTTVRCGDGSGLLGGQEGSSVASAALESVASAARISGGLCGPSSGELCGPSSGCLCGPRPRPRRQTAHALPPRPAHRVAARELRPGEHAELMGTRRRLARRSRRPETTQRSWIRRAYQSYYTGATRTKPPVAPV